MRKKNLFAVLGAVAVVACGPSGDATEGADAASPGGPPPEGSASADGASSGSSGSSGAPGASNLTINAVSFRNVGRKGDALRVAVKGLDEKKETSAMVVRFVDETDAPVIALDTDWDGVPDSAERRFHFEQSTIGQAAFTGAVVIPGVFGPTSKIAKVIVALESESGERSPTKAQAIALQPVRVENDPCDPAKVVDRCEDGLGCSGTPPTCHAGSAPELTAVGYFGGGAPRMLFRGTELDEDVKSISIEFLDNAGQPLSVDLTGDESVMSSGITVDAKGGADGTGFFVATTPIAGFETLVPKIAATVTDDFGRSSARVITSSSVLPIRGAGQSCDPQGFDSCAAGYFCSPGLLGGENKCAASEPGRAAKCSASPVLDPATGKTRAFGTVRGASLWDAPPGCVPNDQTGRPESTIRLHLAKTASILTLSTALPETDFDTAIYLLPGCASSASAALGCNDDTRGYSSTLTLKNVPAGDYTVVVESIHPRGGHFGVSVEVE